MNFETYINLLSGARMSKFIRACNGDKVKAMRLYDYNLRLSGRMFEIVGMFEIILRNRINDHYLTHFNDPNWIVNQAHNGMMLSEKEVDIQNIASGFQHDGVYSNDKMVSSFTLGFWTYMFTKRRYRLGNKTLLRIFPNRPRNTKNSDVFRDLSEIREFRNRIAHHEPICFDANGYASSQFSRKYYTLMKNYLVFMGLDAESVLRGVENPHNVFESIDSL